ncbi:MAG: hypothetical protein IPM69_04935 [Ignavibacteria bacterium]|nr:hypothetical protein [Ignavibacteria bacterium]
MKKFLSFKIPSMASTLALLFLVSSVAMGYHPDPLKGLNVCKGHPPDGKSCGNKGSSIIPMGNGNFQTEKLSARTYRIACPKLATQLNNSAKINYPFNLKLNPGNTVMVDGKIWDPARAILVKEGIVIDVIVKIGDSTISGHVESTEDTTKRDVDHKGRPASGK